MFSNKTYDRIKWVAQILLPAIATFWFTISNLWGLPYCDKILGTISAIMLLLGALLKVSTSKYAGDGDMVIDTTDPDLDIFRMEVNNSLDSLMNKDSVTFKVVHRNGSVEQ